MSITDNRAVDSRTTIRMNEDLKRQAVARARREKVSFTRYVEGAVLQRIKSEDSNPSKQKIVLPTFGDPTKPLPADAVEKAMEQMYEEDLQRIVKDMK